MRRLITEAVFMNLLELKLEQKSAQYAKSLRTKASKNEPQITENLQSIAAEVAAEIVGLEHRFKTEQSLTEKLVGKVRADLSNLLSAGFSEDEAIEKSLDLRAKQNNDALRYTFLISAERYVFAFKKTVHFLVELNYKIPERRIWNAWKNVGTVFDNGYRGINITIISSQYLKFELQFHTKTSFDLKTKTHKLYKQMKSNAVSSQKKEEIKAELVKMAKEVKIPEGVKKL